VGCAGVLNHVGAMGEKEFSGQYLHSTKRRAWFWGTEFKWGEQVMQVISPGVEKKTDGCSAGSFNVCAC